MHTNPPTKSVKRRVTLRDVAEAAGVHLGTVSKALSGKGNLPEATRERIRAVATELGYAPDPMLRALASYRKSLVQSSYHGTLAWLLTDQHLEESMQTHLAFLKSHCEDAAEKLGYRLEEFRLTDVPSGRMEQMLRSRGIEGVLIPPQRRSGQSLPMDLRHVAAVAIGSSLQSPRVNRIQPYQMANIRRLVRVLRQQGFRRIGFFLPRSFERRTQDAYSAGFWLEQLEMPPEERVPMAYPEDFDGEAFLQWFAAHSPDHLIGVPIALSTWMAEAALSPVPISFFGNLPGERHGGLMIDENWPEICRAAVRMLDGRVRHREQGEPQHVHILSIPATFSECSPK